MVEYMGSIWKVVGESYSPEGKKLILEKGNQRVYSSIIKY